jgi:hypothetical protein
LYNFRDTKGRRWTFEVDVFTIRRVKLETGVNLLKAIEPDNDVIDTLGNDLVVLFDVMVSLLQDQLRKADVSTEDFGRALDEEACGNATRALMNAILSFSPKSKAKLLKKAFGKVWKATVKQEELALQRATEAINSPRFDQVVSDAVQNVMSGPKSSS